MPKPDTSYTPYNASPQGIPETESPRFGRFDVQATPGAFGGQIGQAEQQAGKVGEQLGDEASQIATHFAEMTTNSMAENDFANKYSVGAVKLRDQFDQLDDQDKVSGSVAYLKGLNDLGNQFTGDGAPNPLYRQTMSQLIGRHIFAETTGINKEVVDATMRSSAQSKDALMMANAGYAAQNYQNPDVVGQMQDSTAGLQILKHTDLGHDPTDPNSAAVINAAHQNFLGNVFAPGMINSAVADGNVDAATKIRQDYSPVIPGFRQLQIDNFLHSASMQQYGAMGNQALTSGQPLPQVPGAPPYQVQSVVANTAQANGVDPNEALTVARIESSYGANVGSRGTIGQDKGSAGQPLDAQAKALCDNWKAAKQPATDALGRDPQGWEQYVTYQQGSAGGAALLKADPNAKAVDVLRPLYKNPQDALDAIAGNSRGGNATMTVSDFLDQEKKRYNDNFDRAKCDFNGNSPPGDQITDAHEKPGVTVQPAANPMQDYRNWQKAGVVNVQNIMAMPSGPARNALLQDYEQKTRMKEAQANAYKSDLVNQASQLFQDPKFTSMDQIPPDMHAALLEASPNTLTYGESRAEYNIKHQSGVVTEDQQKYGSSINNILDGVWNGKIKDVSDLHTAVSNGSLTLGGYDKAVEELKKMDTPEGAGEAKLREQTFKAVRSMIMGKSDSFGIPDPHGEETYGHAMALVFKAEKDAKDAASKAGTNISQDIYDPYSKNWIGNVAKPLVKTIDQRVAEIGGQSNLSPTMPPLDKRIEGQTYQSPTGPVIWTGSGWVRDIPPSVPLAH